MPFLRVFTPHGAEVYSAKALIIALYTDHIIDDADYLVRFLEPLIFQA